MTYKGRKDYIVEYGPEEGYDLYANRYMQDEAYLNEFDQTFFLRTLRHLDALKVLDLGAGTGRLAPIFLKRKAQDVTAFDVSAEMLAHARATGAYKNIVHGDATDFFPFAFEEFDMVISTMLLVHISTKDLPHVLGECARVLKKGGTLIIVNLAQRRPPKLTIEDGSKIVIKSYAHSPSRIQRELEEIGMEIDQIVDNTTKSEMVATYIVARKIH